MLGTVAEETHPMANVSTIEIAVAYVFSTLSAYLTTAATSRPGQGGVPA
jgi:hypothetical protein